MLLPFQEQEIARQLKKSQVESLATECSLSVPAYIPFSFDNGV